MVRDKQGQMITLWVNSSCIIDYGGPHKNGGENIGCGDNLSQNSELDYSSLVSQDCISIGFGAIPN